MHGQKNIKKYHFKSSQTLVLCYGVSIHLLFLERLNTILPLKRSTGLGEEKNNFTSSGSFLALQTGVNGQTILAVEQHSVCIISVVLLI